MTMPLKDNDRSVNSRRVRAQSSSLLIGPNPPSKSSHFDAKLSSVGIRPEVTPRTLDIKSRPTRYQRGLWLQLMCCAPFRLLSQYFGMEVGG